MSEITLHSETALDRMRRVGALIPVGSRVTCDPAPKDTDADYLLLLDRTNTQAFIDLAREDGWHLSGSEVSDEINRVPLSDRFWSHKLDDLNIISTKSPSFHRRFLAATSVAKKLNLLSKADRIDLFQAVLYGNDCAPAPSFAVEDEVAF